MSTRAPSGRASWLGDGHAMRRALMSEEDLVGDGLAARALERELRALLVLLGERLEDAQRVADDFRIGRGFRLLFQPRQPLHRLGRHLELDASRAALGSLGSGLAASAVMSVMSAMHVS